MNIFSLFLFLLALIASLAKSWRYALGFAIAGLGVWIGFAYLASRPVPAREALASCNEVHDENTTPSLECVAAVASNFPTPERKGEACVYDVAFFKTDPSTVNPQLSHTEGWGMAAAIAVEWIQAHPEQWDLPASEVIGNALASRFPCPESQG